MWRPIQAFTERRRVEGVMYAFAGRRGWRTGYTIYLLFHITLPAIAALTGSDVKTIQQLVYITDSFNWDKAHDLEMYFGFEFASIGNVRRVPSKKFIPH